MDLTLDQVEDADRIVEQMNEQMNEEIRVRDLTILKDDARPSMAMLAACDYMIAAKPDKTSFLERVDLEELVHRFMEQSSQGHTGMKYGESCLEGSAYRPLLYMQLTAGSVVNIKPELVLEAMAAFAGDTFSFLDVQIHRLEMYGDADGKKGEVHTFSSETPCRLLPLSEYDKA